MKQLYKSSTNRKVAGVCGGIGEFFGIDPTLVRLGFVALSLLAGGGLAVYIVAAILMPEREECSRAADNPANT
ncbi:MAG: PspC domain-containing protein [Clostridia bacterium]|nr:PspC domain-containing protein [Clostridia bacterium]